MKTRNFFELPSMQKKVTTGQIIRAFRINFKITQHDLAQVTGIAETNLSAIENDKIEIGIKRSVLIAAAIGLEPSQLLFPNGYEDTFKKEVKAVQSASAKMLAHKRKAV